MMTVTYFSFGQGKRKKSATQKILIKVTIGVISVRPILTGGTSATWTWCLPLCTTFTFQK